MDYQKIWFSKKKKSKKIKYQKSKNWKRFKKIKYQNRFKSIFLLFWKKV